MTVGRRGRSLLAALAVAAVAVACGGGDGAEPGTGDRGRGDAGAGAGEPRRGGRVVYAIEAETTGGWCLPEAQLAVSGIQVARAMFETLTVPDADGGYVPFLAESITPNRTYDEWTIVLRRGIRFHDGSKLTASVVKDNLDAVRGLYPARHPMLGPLVTGNWDEVRAVDARTVVITTKTPWPAFPAHLYGNGRLGMVARAQLDSPDCATEPIGTGPFRLEEWTVNQRLVVERNPDYWREGLPYLDEIEFRPILEASQRVNALQTGEVQLTHTMNPLQVSELRDLAAAGDLALVESDEFADVNYTMLNAAAPPFDDPIARRALATAVDNDTLNEIRHKDIPQNATGPFPPGTMGYLADTGMPAFDLAEAKRLVARYEAAHGTPLAFTLNSTPEPANIETGQLVAEMAAAAGIEVELRQVEEAQLINQVLGGEYQAVFWRNHPGGDPDLQYVWWRSDSPVNFGRFHDAEIDRLLDEGRVEPDRERRRAVYEAVNRRFGEELWNLWGQWSRWAIGTAPGVHGVLGPDLPGGGAPFPGLADGHPVAGLWLDGT